MKKFLDFILSFVLPKKMIRYRNINFFMIVLIFLGCTLLCVGSSNLTLDQYVKNNKESFRLFEEIYDLPNSEAIELPRFTIDETTDGINNFITGEKEDNVYEISYSLDNGKTLNLTLVYEPYVYINDNEETSHDDRFLNFDINGYYNHQPARDENDELLEEDMLFVINNELVYYIFNHGMDLVKDESGTFTKYLESTGWNIMETRYVLPKDETEIFYTDADNKSLDYSKWTESAVRGQKVEIDGVTYTSYDTEEIAYYLPNGKDEISLNAYGDIDITKWTKFASSKDEKVFVDGVEYSAQTRINKNLHEVFVSDNSTRVGVFSLYQAEKLGINLGNLGDGVSHIDPKLMVEAIGDLMVNSGGSQLQYYNFFYAIIFILLMPILWTFATWVMSKKYGELTRFKEYYAICSIAFIVPTILVSIFTLLFQPYCFIAQYAMFIQVAFYIFVIYKINNSNKKTTNQKNQPLSPSNKNEQVIDLKVETTPIQEKVSKTAQME